MKNTNEVVHYIRKNRRTTAMIYLKENDRKAAQKLFCMAYAMDYGYEVLGDTTNLEDIKDCDVMIIAYEAMVSKDENEYKKIVKQLRNKGVKVECAINEDRAGRYIDMALELYRKGRI